MLSRAPLLWSLVGLIAALILPWYALQEGLDSAAWLSGLWSSEDYAGGLAEIVVHGKWWLTPVLLALALCLAVGILPMTRERRGLLLALAAGAALAFFVAEALGIGLRGWNAAWLLDFFG